MASHITKHTYSSLCGVIKIPGLLRGELMLYEHRSYNFLIWHGDTFVVVRKASFQVFVLRTASSFAVPQKCSGHALKSNY